MIIRLFESFGYLELIPSFASVPDVIVPEHLWLIVLWGDSSHQEP